MSTIRLAELSAAIRDDQETRDVLDALENESVESARLVNLDALDALLSEVFAD